MKRDKAWYSLCEAWAYFGEAWARYAGQPELAKDFASLASMLDRRRRGTPRIAIVGPFSAGKTTFVNNMFGTNLPTGLSETTAIPTVIRYGDEERLLFRKGLTWYEASKRAKEEFLSLKQDQPSEGESEGKKADALSPILAELISEHDEVIFETNKEELKGMEVLDTPGLEGRSRKTVEKSIRAITTTEGIIYTFNSKQGITEGDLTHLRKVPKGVPILILMTHVDLIKPSRLAEVEDTVRKILTELEIEYIGILKSGKNGPQSGASVLWAELMNRAKGALEVVSQRLIEGALAKLRATEDIAAEAPISLGQLIAMGDRLLSGVVGLPFPLLPGQRVDGLFLSPEAQRWAASLRQGGEVSLLVDGVLKADGLISVEDFRFLSDGRRWVAKLQRKDRSFLILSEEGEWEFQDVHLVLSADESAWGAYGASKDGNPLLLVDGRVITEAGSKPEDEEGKTGETPNRIEYLAFSPDGRRYTTAPWEVLTEEGVFRFQVTSGPEPREASVKTPYVLFVTRQSNEGYRDVDVAILGQAPWWRSRRCIQFRRAAWLGSPIRLAISYKTEEGWQIEVLSKIRNYNFSQGPYIDVEGPVAYENHWTAAVKKQDGKWYIMVDGEERGGPYQMASCPVIAWDGRVQFLVLRDGRVILETLGTLEKEQDEGQ